MDITFFESGADFRQWLEKHAGNTPGLWVGYYKTQSGQPSLTWPESVDQALCYGWIDGQRKNIDDQRYMIRFTPRKPGSIWSTTNIQRAQELIEQGLMQPAGLQAFQARRASKSSVYSYEQREVELAEPYAAVLHENAAAWAFFEAQAPSYRKAASWWVMSARQEATRRRRLEQLIADSAQGRRLAHLVPRKAPRQGEDGAP